MTQSLFEQLGGEGAVDAAVDIFYRKVLSDPRINRFFEAVNMDAQRVKLKAFLTLAFGGPNSYKGRDLRTAHARFVRNGLDDSHFDAVLGHIQVTLEELGVGPGLVEQVLFVAGSTRDEVLGR
jgi:hemoglobin